MGGGKRTGRCLQLLVDNWTAGSRLAGPREKPEHKPLVQSGVENKPNPQRSR